MNKVQKKSELSRDEIIKLSGSKFVWKIGDIQIKKENTPKDNGEQTGSKSNR